jgi:hypothetical protein
MTVEEALFFAHASRLLNAPDLGGDVPDEYLGAHGFDPVP